MHDQWKGVIIVCLSVMIGVHQCEYVIAGYLSLMIEVHQLELKCDCRLLISNYRAVRQREDAIESYLSGRKQTSLFLDVRLHLKHTHVSHSDDNSSQSVLG